MHFSILFCVYSEITFNIISFFQKLIKGGVGIRAGGLENFSKINKRGGDDYSVLEGTLKMAQRTFLPNVDCVSITNLYKACKIGKYNVLHIGKH